jgi:predicted ATP-dependent Lon-type protease
MFPRKVYIRIHQGLPGWTIFRIAKFENSKKLRAVKYFFLQNTKKRKKNSVAHLVPHAPQKFWPKF